MMSKSEYEYHFERHKDPTTKTSCFYIFSQAIVAILSFDIFHKLNDFESVPINKLEKSIVVRMSWPS